MHATPRCRDAGGLSVKFPPCLRVPALICLLTAFLVAQDTPSARGFDHFYNLEYDQALAEFQKAAQQEPNAMDPHNYIAQTLLYREMYRNGALETQLVSGNNPFLRQKKLNPSPQVDKEFSDEIQKAIDLANQIDTAIWGEVHSLTLYQRPDIAATTSKLANFGAFGFASVAYENIGFTK